MTLHVGYSQTNVNGGIFTNTTWTVVGSPYIVTDDIVVMSGVTLTISPGVTVKFNDTKGMEVRGNLQAIGSISDTIIFTSASNSPTKGIWSNISFWNDLSLYYVKISYATTALVNTNFNMININHSIFFSNITGLDAIGSTSSNIGSIENSRFENNGKAISNVSHADYITNCLFINNEIGLGYVFNVNVSNCSFIGHTDKAIDGYGANYIGNTIQNNNIGLYIKLYNSSWEIRDNTITGNQIGVQARGDATYTPNTGFYDNSICNNSTYNVENIDNISLSFQNNCWCTTDSAAIASSIYDAYDNLALGVVNFSPFKTICLTGIEVLQKTKDVTVYPNPFSDYTTLKFENIKNEKSTLIIFDSRGRLVKTIADIATDEIKIERNNLTSGLYFFQLRNDRQIRATGKLTIE